MADGWALGMGHAHGGGQTRTFETACLPDKQHGVAPRNWCALIHAGPGDTPLRR
jgi:hypothetical protein